MYYTTYKSSVMNTKERRFGMRKKYLTFDKAKAKVASLGIKTRREYIHYIMSNNIKNLTLTPDVSYYYKGWKGFADYLGISQEEYESNKRTQPRFNTSKTTKVQKSQSTIEPNVTVVKNILEGLDPDKVIKFLIAEDVEPDTIVKMVAELDIKSSTLMNDLCKYMQDRSKRQAEVWRPTGYTTAEAQMTTKV